MDKNPDYVGDSCSTDDDNHQNRISVVEKNFTTAKQSNIIPLKSYHLLYGDMTKSDIQQVIYSQEKGQLSTNQYDLVYVNHAIH